MVTMASRNTMFSFRRVRWIVFTVLGLEVLYLLVANLFLQPWAGPHWIRNRPDKILIEWQKGWTVVPGFVHLQGLHLRGRTPAQRWELEVDTLRARIAIPGLLWRRAAVRGIHGSGVNFRLARESDPAGERLDGQATIEGFAPPMQRPRKTRRPWDLKIDVEKLEGIEEIWLLQQRYTGQGQLTGTAHFTVPGGEISVPRAELTLGNGILSVAGIETGEIERLQAQVTIAPYRPRENRGLAGLRFVSGTLELDAPRADIGVLGYLFREVDGLDIEGEGALQAELHLEEGRVAPESFVHAWAQVNTRYLDYLIDGTARVQGTVVTPGGDEPPSRLEVTFDNFSVRQVHQATPYAFGEGAVLQAAGDVLDLVQPHLAWTADLRLPEAKVPDLTYYNAYLPANASVALLAGKGLVSVDLRFDLSSAEVWGEGQISGQGVDLLFHETKLRGDLTIDTKIRSGDATARRFDISGTRLRVDRAQLGNTSSRDAKGWWGELEMRRGELHLSPLGLRSELALRMRDTGPLVSLLNQGKDRPTWLNRLLEIENIAGHGALEYRDASVDLEGVELRLGDKLKFLGELKLSRETPHLLIYCKYGGLTVAVEQKGRTRDWGLVRSLRWYEARRASWR